MVQYTHEESLVIKLIKIKEFEDLKNYEYKIRKQKELIEYYDSMACSTNGNDLSIIPNNGSKKNVAPFIKWLEKKEEAELRLVQMSKEHNDLTEKATVLIEKMENVDFCRILSYRYLMYEKWETIALKMKLSLSIIRRYHLKALDELSIIKR